MSRHNNILVCTLLSPCLWLCTVASIIGYHWSSSCQYVQWSGSPTYKTINNQHKLLLLHKIWSIITGCSQWTLKVWEVNFIFILMIFKNNWLLESRDPALIARIAWLDDILTNCAKYFPGFTLRTLQDYFRWEKNSAHFPKLEKIYFEASCVKSLQQHI